MSKVKIILCVVAVTLLALTAAMTFTVVTRNANASGSRITTIHLAFAGLVTTGQTKDTPITGGLTEVVRADGYFNGNMHLDDGTQISTSGRLVGSKFSITFYNVNGTPAVQGSGHSTHASDYVGTFKEYYAGQVTGTGVWSASHIRTPSQIHAFTFAGIDTDGHDSGAIYAGTLTLNKKSLTGTCNLTNGLVLPVRVVLGHNHKFTITIHLPYDRTIVGTGTLSHVDGLNGFAGSFTGPTQNDTGRWVIYGFNF